MALWAAWRIFGDRSVRFVAFVALVNFHRVLSFLIESLENKNKSWWYTRKKIWPFRCSEFVSFLQPSRRRTFLGDSSLTIAGDDGGLLFTEKTISDGVLKFVRLTVSKGTLRGWTSRLPNLEDFCSQELPKIAQVKFDILNWSN